MGIAWRHLRQRCSAVRQGWRESFAICFCCFQPACVCVFFSHVCSIPFWYLLFPACLFLFCLRTGLRLATQVWSATNAACDIYSNATDLVSYWPPCTTEEDGIASFVADVIGRGACGENVSRPTMGLGKRSKTVKRFLKKQPFPFFLCLFPNESDLLQGMSAESLAQIVEDLTG